MKKSKIGIKYNNKGFTLVELLIAITILAIIVGPMLHAFVTAVSMNSKSRRNLNATTVATDIVEGIKGNDFSVIVDEVNNYNPATFDIIDSSLIKGSVGKISESDGKFSFYIEQLEPLKEQYDALVELDATPYRGTSLKDPKYQYNNVEMPKFTSVKGKSFVQKDADELQINNTGTLYRLAAASNSGMSSYTEDQLKEMLYRTITVNITKDASDVVEAKVVYKYTLKGAGLTEVSTQKETTIYNSNDVRSSSSSSSSSSSAATPSRLKLYLFYYPIYNSLAGNIHDEIVINNKDNVELDMFLARQEIASSTLQSDEMLYRTRVTVEETGIKADASTHIRTNMDDNLYYLYNKSVAKTISDRCQYRYKSNSSIITNQNTCRTAFDISNLADSQIQDRFYDIKVTIFKTGAVAAGNYTDNKIYEITGTTLE